MQAGRCRGRGVDFRIGQDGLNLSAALPEKLRPVQFRQGGKSAQVIDEVSPRAQRADRPGGSFTRVRIDLPCSRDSS